MNTQQLKTYYDILTDAWRLFKKYYEVEEVNWDEVWKETKELVKKYDESSFSREIALAVYGELARIKERNEKQHGN